MVTEHVRTPKFKKLEKQYKEQVEQIGVFISPFSPKDGYAIVEQAGVLADATISYAEVNKNFCNALERVLNASPLVAMISAYAGLFMAIASNHGVNPIENAFKKRLEKNGKDNIPGLSNSFKA